MLTWNDLTDLSQLDTIKEQSFSNPVVIFKHSTRCSISSMALSRFERQWNQEKVGDMQAYYLDLIQYRPISNQIEELFSVTHESPQLLLIKDGKCIYHASHSAIYFDELIEKV